MPVATGCITYDKLARDFAAINEQARQEPLLLQTQEGRPVAVVVSAELAATVKGFADALKSAGMSPGITSTPLFVWQEDVGTQQRNVLTKIQYGTAVIFMREDAPDVLALIPLSPDYTNGAIKRLVEEGRHHDGDQTTLYDDEAVLARLGLMMPDNPA